MPRTKGSTTLNRTEPDGTTKIWNAMRFMKTFSLEELEQTTHLEYSPIRKYVSRLYKAGYLRLTSRARGDGSCNSYRLIRDTGPRAPIPRYQQPLVFDANTRKTYEEEARPTARQRMWELICRGQPFTSEDLIGLGVRRGNALKYLGELVKARFVLVLRTPKPGPGGELGVYCIRPGKSGAKAPKF